MRLLTIIPLPSASSLAGKKRDCQSCCLCPASLPCTRHMHKTNNYMLCRCLSRSAFLLLARTARGREAPALEIVMSYLHENFEARLLKANLSCLTGLHLVQSLTRLPLVLQYLHDFAIKRKQQERAPRTVVQGGSCAAFAAAVGCPCIRTNAVRRSTSTGPYPSLSESLCPCEICSAVRDSN